MADIEVQVTEIKKLANVKLENAERLSMGDYSQSLLGFETR